MCLLCVISFQQPRGDRDEWDHSLTYCSDDRNYVSATVDALQTKHTVTVIEKCLQKPHEKKMQHKLTTAAAENHLLCLV